MSINIHHLLVLLSSALLLIACDHRPQPTVSISSFIGTFNMKCIETYNRTNEQWSVTINYTTARRNNGRTWVVISGLYYGNDFMNAYGYYDPSNKCIRIPANIPDKENTFYFEDDPSQASYYALFTPCRLTENWETFYYTHDEKDEMWLRMETNGRLRLGAADGSSAEEETFYDSYTFFYFYESTENAPDDNYFYILTDAVFSRTGSYYTPSRQHQRMKQHNRAIPLQKQSTHYIVPNE